MGDNIILGIDMNEDTHTDPLALEFKQLHLKDVVLLTHPFVSSPATSNNNKNMEPIEDIWVRKNVEVTCTRYMPLNGSPPAPSDGYQMVLAELDNCSSLSKHIPPIKHPIQVEKVKSTDPKNREDTINS